jgi:hypothetical protein
VLEACDLSDSIPHLTSSNIPNRPKPVNDQEIDVNLSNGAKEERRSKEKDLNTSNSTTESTNL